MSFFRSLLHMAWLVLTVIPYTLAIMLVAVLGLDRRYRDRKSVG